MLKKLLSIGMLAGLLVAATSVSAQDEPEYPRYGFWSNWSIGVSFDYDKQCNGHGWDFKEGTSIGGSIFLEKELNYVWDLRLRATMPGFVTKDEDTPANDKYALFGTFTAGFKFSVNDALMGYNPERRGSLYLFADAGVAAWRNYVSCTEDITKNVHRLNLAMDAGLGYSYKLCKHSTIFAEMELIDIAHVPNIFEGNHNGLDAMFSIGYAFNFGVTAADEELIAQRNLLTQENLDALNDQIANLEKQVADGKKQEKKLEDRISQLENDLNNARLNSGNNKAAEELQAKIDQIKADQLTFYALPFSIQYGVDQYKVTDEEMLKLQAIARVMKDNPNTNYMIYGFADYTGSDEYNMKLSEKRAKEVKRILVNKYGIAESRLDVQWKGKSTAFGDIKYSVNRRVSIYRVIE